MERKSRMGWSALRIIGLVYSSIAFLFAVLGSSFLFASDDPDLKIIGSIFSILGGVFLILGCSFLMAVAIRKKRNDALIAGQKFIWANVVDITPNYQIRVNGRSPVVFTLRYTDGQGTEHIFRSHNVNTYRDERLLGKQVRVYIQDERYRHYYVDVEEILPRVVEH